MVEARELPEGVGIPWFRPDHYSWLVERLGSYSPFPARYDEWRELADTLEQDLRRQGKIAIRVNVEPDRLMGWCKAMGLTLDEWSVGAFAAAMSGTAIKHVRAA